MVGQELGYFLTIVVPRKLNKLVDQQYLNHCDDIFGIVIVKESCITMVIMAKRFCGIVRMFFLFSFF